MAQDIDGLVQDYSNSIANALELLQSYAKLKTKDIATCIMRSHAYFGRITKKIGLYHISTNRYFILWEAGAEFQQLLATDVLTLTNCYKNKNNSKKTT